ERIDSVNGTSPARHAKARSKQGWIRKADLELKRKHY
ncbi:MAG: hypothetical protein RIR29_444, partial [Actinomycetota bacterium]